MAVARRGLMLAAGVLLLLAPTRAWAGAPTDRLKAEIDRVLEVLEDPELKKPGKVRERRAAVRRIADGIFDFGETAKRSLARHWAARTPAEREGVGRVFATLLGGSNLSRIRLYGGGRGRYLAVTPTGD